MIQDEPDFPTPPVPGNLPALAGKTRLAGLASIPRRATNLAFTIRSLYDQIDHFFVYLNGYDTVPGFLDDARITLFRSQDYIDLNATGKVFFLDHVERGHFFTIDDDFIFPRDYAARMIDTIERYGGRVAATVHGSIFPPQAEYYYLRTGIYQYQQRLDTDRFVCLPGTGSFVHDRRSLRAGFADFMPQVMVDLTFAILAKQQGIPIVAARRPHCWLQNTDREGLYQQFNFARTHHSHYARRFRPWGLDAYAPAIRAALDAALARAGDDPEAAAGLDQDVLAHLRGGALPYAWSLNAEFFERYDAYRDLVDTAAP